MSMFDPNNHKYKCCCNSCHVKTGTTVIGILEAIGLVVSVIQGIVNYTRSETIGNLITPVISLVIWSIVLVFLFVGLNKRKAGYLIPHLILQVISMVGLVIGIIVMIYILVTTNEIIFKYVGREQIAQHVNPENALDDLEKAIIIVGVVMLIAFLIALAFEIWFFLVVKACYTFFKDLKAATEMTPGLHYQPNNMTVTQVPAYPQGYPQQAAYPQGYPQQAAYPQMYPQQAAYPAKYP